MKENIQEEIMQLQMLEQNLQNILMQKQQFQAQLNEAENALKELEKAKGDTYKIIGTVMIASNKTDLKKELKEKQETSNLRIKNIEKQEKLIKEKSTELQNKVMKSMKK
ncbi:prefoldin subunit beta [archaeon]|nr:prefoldin subunit beta [archaeon]|tara:strand:- start:779 stop:1105 length:327 start_codon:yes stop_codon:yes gene_type:complete